MKKRITGSFQKVTMSDFFGKTINPESPPTALEWNKKNREEKNLFRKQ